uniref:Uncharacterized protein n=1 Tax=Fagus sylvatica TaxID=28930 RepID=A0A2N9IDI7_FAGSY
MATKTQTPKPIETHGLRRSKAHLFCCYGVTAFHGVTALRRSTALFFFFIVILHGVPSPSLLTSNHGPEEEVLSLSLLSASRWPYLLYLL